MEETNLMSFSPEGLKNEPKPNNSIDEAILTPQNNKKHIDSIPDIDDILSTLEEAYSYSETNDTNNNSNETVLEQLADIFGETLPPPEITKKSSKRNLHKKKKSHNKSKSLDIKKSEKKNKIEKYEEGINSNTKTQEKSKEENIEYDKLVLNNEEFVIPSKPNLSIKTNIRRRKVSFSDSRSSSVDYSELLKDLEDATVSLTPVKKEKASEITTLDEKNNNEANKSLINNNDNANEIKNEKTEEKIENEITNVETNEKTEEKIENEITKEKSEEKIENEITKEKSEEKIEEDIEEKIDDRENIKKPEKQPLKRSASLRNLIRFGIKNNENENKENTNNENKDKNTNSENKDKNTNSENKEKNTNENKEENKNKSTFTDIKNYFFGFSKKSNTNTSPSSLKSSKSISKTQDKDENVNKDEKINSSTEIIKSNDNENQSESKDTKNVEENINKEKIENENKNEIKEIVKDEIVKEKKEENIETKDTIVEKVEEEKIEIKVTEVEKNSLNEMNEDLNNIKSMKNDRYSKAYSVLDFYGTEIEDDDNESEINGKKEELRIKTNIENEKEREKINKEKQSSSILDTYSNRDSINLDYYMNYDCDEVPATPITPIYTPESATRVLLSPSEETKKELLSPEVINKLPRAIVIPGRTIFSRHRKTNSDAILSPRTERAPELRRTNSGEMLSKTRNNEITITFTKNKNGSNTNLGKKIGMIEDPAISNFIENYIERKDNSNELKRIDGSRRGSRVTFKVESIKKENKTEINKDDEDYIPVRCDSKVDSDLRNKSMDENEKPEELNSFAIVEKHNVVNNRIKEYKIEDQDVVENIENVHVKAIENINKNNNGHGHSRSHSHDRKSKKINENYENKDNNLFSGKKLKNKKKEEKPKHKSFFRRTENQIKSKLSMITSSSSDSKSRKNSRKKRNSTINTHKHQSTTNPNINSQLRKSRSPNSSFSMNIQDEHKLKELSKTFMEISQIKNKHMSNSIISLSSNTGFKINNFENKSKSNENKTRSRCMENRTPVLENNNNILNELKDDFKTDVNVRKEMGMENKKEIELKFKDDNDEDDDDEEFHIDQRPVVPNLPSFRKLKRTTSLTNESSVIEDSSSASFSHQRNRSFSDLPNQYRKRSSSLDSNRSLPIVHIANNKVYKPILKSSLTKEQNIKKGINNEIKPFSLKSSFTMESNKPVHKNEDKCLEDEKVKEMERKLSNASDVSQTSNQYENQNQNEIMCNVTQQSSLTKEKEQKLDNLIDNLKEISNDDVMLFNPNKNENEDKESKYIKTRPSWAKSHKDSITFKEKHMKSSSIASEKSLEKGSNIKSNTITSTSTTLSNGKINNINTTTTTSTTSTTVNTTTTNYNNNVNNVNNVNNINNVNNNNNNNNNNEEEELESDENTTNFVFENMVFVDRPVIPKMPEKMISKRRSSLTRFSLNSVRNSISSNIEKTNSLKHQSKYSKGENRYVPSHHTKLCTPRFNPQEAPDSDMSMLSMSKNALSEKENRSTKSINTSRINESNSNSSSNNNISSIDIHENETYSNNSNLINLLDYNNNNNNNINNFNFNNYSSSYNNNNNNNCININNIHFGMGNSFNSKSSNIRNIMEKESSSSSRNNNNNNIFGSSFGMMNSSSSSSSRNNNIDFNIYGNNGMNSQMNQNRPNQDTIFDVNSLVNNISIPLENYNNNLQNNENGRYLFKTQFSRNKLQSNWDQTMHSMSLYDEENPKPKKNTAAKKWKKTLSIFKKN